MLRLKVMSLGKGYEKEMRRKVKGLLKQGDFNNLKLVRFRPDIVLVYGGDGSILYSESKYPGKPKVIIKKSHFCNKCDYPEDELENILKEVDRGNYEIVEYKKIEAVYKGKSYIGLNEVQIRNVKPIQAIRFDLYVLEDGKEHRIMSNVVGDGVLFSTPFGSSSYYRVLGGHSFEEGIGVALNNVLLNYKKKPMVYPENTIFKFRLLRGEAYLARDNNPDLIFLSPGSEVLIGMSKHTAKFLMFKNIKVLSNYIIE